MNEPKRRGQVMALGAVTMLVLALMLMLSFSLTRAVHEKIRLQSHSDAMAYSMATVGARAMNYYAYSNRAIAASAVSIMTLHAYHSSMSLTGSAFTAGQWAFAQIAGWHTALFLASCPACNFAELANAIRAGIIAGRFGRQARQYNQAVRGVEARFNQAVMAYSMMIDSIWGTQQMVTFQTVRVLTGNGLDSLHDINAPCASQLAPGVAAMNAREFACALEGSPIDMGCIGGRARSTLRARGNVISNVANAARGDWPKGRSIPFPTLMHPQALQLLMQRLQGEGFTAPVLLGGGGKAINGMTMRECEGQGNNPLGTTICGTDDGLLTAFFRNTPPGIMPFNAQVYSNRNGGRHLPGAADQGRHDRWNGFGRIDNPITCLTQGECFTNFRSDPTARQDFGQPKVFGHFQQNLRETYRCTRGPWEVGSDGKLTVGDGARGDGVLDFLPNEPATAVSKAMIYFHRPDDWRMPPNAFDPYWKAKLHPMRNAEAAAVLTAAGDLQGAAMALTGPVDGRDPL